MRSPRKEFVRGLAELAPCCRQALMKRLTVLITGLQVLAHSVMGCCAHEERASAGCIHPGYCQSAGESAPCEHSHGRRTSSVDGACASMSTADGTQNSDPRQEHQCPHDACQWIVQKDVTAAGQLIQMAYVSAIAQADSCVSCALLTLVQPATPPTFAPPVRRHLWVGVLLI